MGLPNGLQAESGVAMSEPSSFAYAAFASFLQGEEWSEKP